MGAGLLAGGHEAVGLDGDTNVATKSSDLKKRLASGEKRDPSVSKIRREGERSGPSDI